MKSIPFLLFFSFMIYVLLLPTLQVLQSSPKEASLVFTERLFLRVVNLLAGGAAIHGIQGVGVPMAAGDPSGGLPSVLAAEVAAFRCEREG